MSIMVVNVYLPYGTLSSVTVSVNVAFIPGPSVPVGKEQGNDSDFLPLKPGLTVILHAPVVAKMDVPLLSIVSLVVPMPQIG